MDNDKDALESAEQHHVSFTTEANGDSDDEFSSDGDGDHIFINFSVQSICGIFRYCQLFIRTYMLR